MQVVAGKAAPEASLVDSLLEGDFDPDEYDKKMAAAFNDDYYQEDEEDGHEIFGDDLDDILGEDPAAADGAGDGFAALHKKLKAEASSKVCVQSGQWRLLCVAAHVLGSFSTHRCNACFERERTQQWLKWDGIRLHNLPAWAATHFAQCHCFVLSCATA